MWPLVLLYAALPPRVWSIHHIRMNMITAIDLVSKSTEFTHNQLALIHLMNQFDISVETTRIGLITYAGTATVVLEPSGDKEAYRRALEKQQTADSQSIMFQALEEAVKVFDKPASREALKVTVVITNSVPYNKENYPERWFGTKPAERLTADGLLYIIFHEKYSDRSSTEGVLYMKTLVGHSHRFIHVDAKDQLDSELIERFRRILLSDICKTKLEVCRFENDNETCVPDAFYRSNFTDDCDQLTAKFNNQSQCSVSRCFEDCDRFWPWESTPICLCDVGRRRQGPNPFAKRFALCPTESRCLIGCESTESTTTTSTTAPPTTTFPVGIAPKFVLPIWLRILVGSAIIFVLLAMIISSYAVYRRRFSSRNRRRQIELNQLPLTASVLRAVIGEVRKADHKRRLERLRKQPDESSSKASGSIIVRSIMDRIASNRSQQQRRSGKSTQCVIKSKK